MVSREARPPVHCGCNAESSVGAGIGWSRRGVVGGHKGGACLTLLAMADPWFALALLRASVLTLVPMSFGLGWASLAVAGMSGPPRPHPDLLALGLDRAPSSWDELRTAYRSAARATHPDASGGSKEAFLAVAGAFERLSEKLGRRTT